MPPTHTDEGIRAAVDIRTNHPATAVLVFSQWVETGYARQLLADHPDKVGYLLKDRIVATGDSIDAVRRVTAGGTALDPEVVRQLLARPTVDAGLARLTARERDILARLAEGRSNQAVADELHLASAAWRSTSPRSSPSSTCPPPRLTTGGSWRPPVHQLCRPDRRLRHGLTDGLDGSDASAQVDGLARRLDGSAPATTPGLPCTGSRVSGRRWRDQAGAGTPSSTTTGKTRSVCDS